MLEQVELAVKHLNDYRPIAGDKVVAQIAELAEPLRDARVVHINATAFGGGVAEMLQTLVPLMRDAGLDAEWQVIAGDDAFFNVTKAAHNGLQGMDIPFTDDMKRIWQQYNKVNAEAFEGTTTSSSSTTHSRPVCSTTTILMGMRIGPGAATSTHPIPIRPTGISSPPTSRSMRPPSSRWNST